MAALSPLPTSPTSCDQAQNVNVTEALQYLEEKGVKQILHQLTQALLLDRPADPQGYMLERLKSAVGSSQAQDSVKANSCEWAVSASNFLAQACRCPRAAVQALLQSVSQSTSGVLYFYSAPGCCGRRVSGRGQAAQRLSSQNFLLVASSDSRAVPGEAGTGSRAACLQGALASPGGACAGSSVACTVQTSEGIDGILLLELAQGSEASGMLAAVRLWSLALAERLNSLRWQLEAQRSSAVIESMLTGLDVLAHPTDHGTDTEGMTVSAVNHVAEDLVRGILDLPDVSVWQTDSRTGHLRDTAIGTLSREPGHAASTLAVEALAASKTGKSATLCAEEATDSQSAEPSGPHLEICVALPLAARPADSTDTTHAADRRAVVCFTSNEKSRSSKDVRSGQQQLDHFDLVAAELLSSSTVPHALQARTQFDELLLMKSRREQMKVLVSELSTATSCIDLCKTIERAVQAITHSERCFVFFVDDDAEEVWSPPCESRPSLCSYALDSGIVGQMATLAEDDRAHFERERLSNDPSKSIFWTKAAVDDFLRRTTNNFVVSPIVTAGKETHHLGLVLASNKYTTLVSGSQEAADYDQHDAEFLEWLGGAAGSHVERLQLDVMWTKALLERESAEGDELEVDFLQDEDQMMLEEYYSADARAIGSGRRGGLKQAVMGVKTVHRFIDSGASAVFWQKSHEQADVCEDTAILAQIDSGVGDVEIDAWQLDYWALTDEQMFMVVIKSLRQFQILEALSVRMCALSKFFKAVKKDYNNVPFHNFYHAMSTVHMAFRLVKVSGLPKYMTPGDLFALIIASLCHDCNHRGFNNAFEMMTRSELALRYNDFSPLENHHCARAFEIAFGRDGCNIFEDLRPEVYNSVRKQMVAGILATDMKHHGHHVELLRDFSLGDISDSQSQFLVEVMIHAADISNPFMPADTSRRWCQHLNEEFTAQVKEEEKLGLPVTSFMTNLTDPKTAAKSLMGFIDFVILPFTSSVFRIFPDLHEPKHFLESNREHAAKVVDPDKQPKTKSSRGSALVTSG
eukprot:TRINITY_DN17098_c0_g1_i1.p1 TRINITY_DN17098_c0_g1~~TRINITY_DN17098_c0_g1_i1.p1  ORF type:complete len:1060 (+),score=219.57 TRINITY_DN17098_c0_g1_i1:85-3180(+)